MCPLMGNAVDAPILIKPITAYDLRNALASMLSGY